jgi:hypothetical protein
MHRADAIIEIKVPSEDDSGKILRALNLLLRVGEANMTAISDFVIAQNEFQRRMDEAVRGISADIEALNARIAELQSSETISDADQQALNELHVRSQNITSKLEEIDSMKPPEAPSVG